MPARHFEFQIDFAGGWATNVSGGITVSPEQGQVSLPYLTDATNVLFEAGSVRTIGGALLAHKTDYGQIISVLPVAGGSDLPDVYTVHESYGLIAWRLGTDATEIAVELAQIPLNPSTTDAVYTVNEFEGYTIIATDDINVRAQLIVPSTLTATPLSSAEPDFSMSAIYAGRLWVAGDPANPSRLYYSDLNDPTGGYSSNTFDIDPFEGSEITALAVFRGRLFIFKGPTDGSIHILSGRTPSTFALDEFSDSVGCAGPNAFAEFSNDVMFYGTDGQIHSLAATQNFGDFERSNQSLPIADFLRVKVPLTQLKFVSMHNDTTDSRIWLSVPTGIGISQRQVIAIDYANGIKFSKIDYITSSSVVPARGASVDFGQNYILANQGKFLYSIDVEGQERVETYDSVGTVTSATYKSSALSPKMKFLPNFGSNTVERVCVALEARSIPGDDGVYEEENVFDPSTSFNLTWQRDITTVESVTINQTFGSRLTNAVTLGPPPVTTHYPETGQFILNTSQLGGPRAVETYAELESWDFRRLAIGFEKEELNSSAKIHSISLHITSEDATNTENYLI